MPDLLDYTPQPGGIACLTTKLSSPLKSSTRERHVLYALTLTIMNLKTWRTRPGQWQAPKDPCAHKRKKAKSFAKMQSIGEIPPSQTFDSLLYFVLAENYLL